MATTIAELKEKIEKFDKQLSKADLPPVARNAIETAKKAVQKELADAERVSDEPIEVQKPSSTPKTALEDAKNRLQKEKSPVKKKVIAKKVEELERSEKLKDKITKELPTQKELQDNADVLPAEKLKTFQRVRIGCEMFAEQNESGKAIVVDTVIGKAYAYPGDWILYLGDGYAFTVVQKSEFSKRCIILQEGEKSQLTVKRANGKTVKVKNTEGGEIIEKEKRKKRGITSSVSSKVEKLSQSMKSKGCRVSKFLAETDMTPIDNGIWGRIAQWNARTSKEKITKAGIEKGVENPRFIVETVDYSNLIFKDVRYYSICPESGEWSLITEAEKSEIEKKFDNKEFKIQYSKAELNRMYNYGDPAMKSYESLQMECKAIAKDAYQTRIEKGHAEARPKYQKHYNTCRNQVFNEYNREFLIQLNDAARKHKEQNKGITFREAFKHVRAHLKDFFND